MSNLIVSISPRLELNISKIEHLKLFLSDFVTEPETLEEVLQQIVYFCNQGKSIYNLGANINMEKIIQGRRQITIRYSSLPVTFVQKLGYALAGVKYVRIPEL